MDVCPDDLSQCRVTGVLYCTTRMIQLLRADRLHIQYQEKTDGLNDYSTWEPRGITFGAHTVGARPDYLDDI
jgi:hypothetical protein